MPNVGFDFLGTALKFRKRRKNSSSLVLDPVYMEWGAPV